MADATAGGASGAGRNSRTDLISMITQLAPQLFGTGKTTVSETSGKSLSPEQMQSLLSNMMASSSGLASVMMPQRQAGLYSSPVNTLLTQQLSSNLAAKVAEMGTPTTTTRTQQTAASPAGKAGVGLLGALQAASMVKKAVQSPLAKKAGTVLGDVVNPAKYDAASAGGSLSSNIGNSMKDLGMSEWGAESAIDSFSSNIGNSLQDFGMEAWAPQINELAANGYGAMSMANPVIAQLLGGGEQAAPILEQLSQVFESSTPVSAAMEIGGTENAGPFGISSQSSSAGTSVAASAGDAVASSAAEGAGSAATDWIANTPGNEAADYLASLGEEGMGVGMDLADVGGSQAFDFGGIPYLSVASNLASGNSRAAVGNVLGSYFGPIGSFVGGILGPVVGSLSDDLWGAGTTAQDVFDPIGSLTGEGSFSDVIESNLDPLGIFGGDSIFGGGGGCFLTTACMVALADEFRDDCRELEAMRTLRDGYAQTLDEGPALINQYYKTAPSYVMWINAREDSEDVWKHLYQHYILPAVVAVEKEHMHRAYEIYVQMVGYVKEMAEEEGV